MQFFKRLRISILLGLVVVLLFSFPLDSSGRNYYPSVNSITPTSGNGNNQVFYTRYYDKNGYRNLYTARLLANTRLNITNSAYFLYNQNTNKFYLRTGSRLVGGYKPRSNATISNSYARLYLRDSYVSGSGTRLTVRWHVRFLSGMYGKNLATYGHAMDDRGLSSRWIRLGSWRVPTGTTSGGDLGFQVFPPDNPWNTDISGYPVDPNSADYIASIGAGTGLHPDFGTVWDGGPNGIPYVLVAGSQPKVPVSFYYPEESDPGPYPIPDDIPVEWGSDHHIIVVDTTNRLLYEVFDATKTASGWDTGSGAIFDLTSNELRPDYWTSADAAGLPIFPGLVRYEEVQAGSINHALRFTVSRTQQGFIHPATHYASSDTNPDLPPMGLRLRLKSSVDISGFSPKVQVILQALKTYGMFVADNGGDWFISGSPNPSWNDEELHRLNEIVGSDFEVVSTGTIIR